jgi:hypothetical protein
VDINLLELVKKELLARNAEVPKPAGLVRGCLNNGYGRLYHNRTNFTPALRGLWCPKNCQNWDLAIGRSVSMFELKCFVSSHIDFF